MDRKHKDLFSYILQKDDLKKRTSENTRLAFELLHSYGKFFVDNFRELKEMKHPASDLRLSFTDRSPMEFAMRFSSDVLLFTMHTDVFEFSRTHEVMKTPYIKEDEERSYCGVIHIYNFLADSIEYGRELDLGYLIGRVFINKEKHYFIEGKQELGLIYSAFGHSVFDKDAAKKLIESAVEYTAKFDLLTPPYDEIKEITVGDAMVDSAYKRQRTAKRLGFQFKADRM